MRTFTLCVVLVASLAGCAQKKEEKTLSTEELITDPSKGGATPKLVFEDTLFNFGSVLSGTIVKHSFKFVNKGDGQLIISNAQASCGCTVPTFPHDPIPPGGSGQIDVEFNSSGRAGKQNKAVTVFANTAPPTSRLMLEGKVEATPDEDPAP